MSSLPASPPPLRRFELRALGAGIAASALCGLVAIYDRPQFFRSYLLGYLFWMAIPLGGLAVLMLHHVTGGGWGLLIRRPLEAAARTLPLLALLLAPLLFGLRELYPWASPDAVAADEVLRHKSSYLNVPGFVLRAVFYFAVWGLLAFCLSRWSLMQDRENDLRATRRLQRISGPGLVLALLTITFASVDWVMSLDPHWFSTIFGFLLIAGDVLAALAFGVCVVALLARYRPLCEFASPARLHDLGNLILTFVLLWAYMAFSQYLIIWLGNLPEESAWYVVRTRAGWTVVPALLIGFHFALPFALLLARRTKRALPRLTAVAGLLLFMRLVDLFWLLAPGFHPARPRIHWMDLAAPVAIGGFWLAVFSWQLRVRPLLPLNDPGMAVLTETSGGES
jgi:hypothetical protein